MWTARNCCTSTGTKGGVATGHTPRGQKRAYHPLLAIVAEAKLVAGFWLRPGNSRCDTNAVGFMQ